MTKALAFTEHSMTKAIRAVEKTGNFVVGMRPDGTLLIAPKPLDIATLVPAESPAEAPSKWERGPV